MLVQGRVIDNDDPEGTGRLRVHIPSHHGVHSKDSVWYQGCLPTRSFTLPSIGEWLWLMPINKAMTNFVWMGWAPCNSASVNTQQISEPDNFGPTYKIVKADHGHGRPVLQVDKQPTLVSGPDRHTALKTPGGITFAATDNLTLGRYNEAKTLDEMGRMQRALLTEDDDFKWEIRDPLGNHIIMEHIDKTTKFSIGTRLKTDKGFQLLHTSDTGELTLIDKVNKNSVKMNKEKVILTSQDGKGPISISGVNAEGGEEPMVLGTQLKDLLDALYDALNTWAPVPMDGGTALKTLLTTFLTNYGLYKGSSASKSYLTEPI